MSQSESRRSRVAEQCDICKEERLSVLEGDRYVCEVCLDGNPPTEPGIEVKV